MQFREYTTTVTINDDQIMITSKIGSSQVSAVVDRDGSEDTNFATVANLHKSIALDTGPVATSPRISVLTPGRWTKSYLGDSFTTSSTVADVPIGNSGDVILRQDPGVYTNFYYSLNGGSLTAFADLDEITLSDGDTLAFAIAGLGAQEMALGYVYDKDTDTLIDNIQLLNTTP